MSKNLSCSERYRFIYGKMSNIDHCLVNLNGIFLFCIGLIVDTTGSYSVPFYLTGAMIVVFSVICQVVDLFLN